MAELSSSATASVSSNNKLEGDVSTNTDILVKDNTNMKSNIFQSEEENLINEEEEVSDEEDKRGSSIGLILGITGVVICVGVVVYLLMRKKPLTQPSSN
tara:strand:+ start:516 stop:812 length:297 start_codon:yes stop_codon:yes gene_type:complete